MVKASFNGFSAGITRSPQINNVKRLRAEIS
jgi:hypothetical protein